MKTKKYDRKVIEKAKSVVDGLNKRIADIDAGLGGAGSDAAWNLLKERIEWETDIMDAERTGSTSYLESELGNMMEFNREREED